MARGLCICSVPARATLVASGSPPPVSTAWLSESVPPRLRIEAQAWPATIGSKVTGRASCPCATKLLPGLTVTVALRAMRTTAQGSIVTEE